MPVQDDFSNLKRPRQPMPDFVKKVLNEAKLMGAYKLRPPYQQNDYLMWINKARRESTKLKRLQQMLDELEKGNLYMKMKYNPKK